MAIATGLVKSRVDQIIRDLSLADNARKAREAVERVRRHAPGGADLSIWRRSVATLRFPLCCGRRTSQSH
jgi:hypothetical protein